MLAMQSVNQELLTKPGLKKFQKTAPRITISSAVSRSSSSRSPHLSNRNLKRLEKLPAPRGIEVASSKIIPRRLQRFSESQKVKVLELTASKIVPRKRFKANLGQKKVQNSEVILPRRIQDNLGQQNSGNSDISTMSSTNVLPIKHHLPSVNEGSNEDIAGKSVDNQEQCRVNGDVVTRENGDNAGVFKKVLNGNEKYGKILKRADPFEYMRERKLSEPVMSPRKRSIVLSPKLARCRSTVDLRENEQPMVLRELGGYKFFQKPSDTIESSSSRKTSRGNDNKSFNQVELLRKTILEQKANITTREKHVLVLEKKLATLEHENAKNKKQLSLVREKLKDCTGTVDYLRREKEMLASERDRLSFTLLACEHELKELRAQNMNLATEYQSAEHSRKIAVGHLQEVERVCQESHQEKPDKPIAKPAPPQVSPVVRQNSSRKKSRIYASQLKFCSEAVQKLKLDREYLNNEQTKLCSFFAENLKVLVEQVEGIKLKLVSVKKPAQMSENGPRKISTTEQIPSSDEVFVATEEPAKNCEESVINSQESTTGSEELSELGVFKKKLKSNEQCIDRLANQIRDLENRKKGLLESRFAMIQEFQAGREFVEDLETEERPETEERTEQEAGGDRKRSRVTKKIRKLERTLSMDHGVGKLDCISKLCKKLEDCEQRIHELESTNSELRAEHDDMEEEAKYLKYVLSYRGDVMKAQLQNEYDNKMAAMKDELDKVRKAGSNGNSEMLLLKQRNESLEEEVQRLHEELSTLLQNLPALQTAERNSSVSSDYEKSTLSVSTDSANCSFIQVDNSQNTEEIQKTGKDISEAGNTTENPGLMSTKDTTLSMKFVENSRNSVQCLEDKVDQLTQEKRVLLMSVQTLTDQLAASHVSGNDSSCSRNVLEKNLRELESENACLSETLQRVRAVLEAEHDKKNEQLLKLREEMQVLDKKVEASRKAFTLEKTKEAVLTCPRHEERISELEMEVYRLHEEKKSLLSSIVRLQTDPNFTLSDDVDDSDVMDERDVINKSDVSDSSDVINPGDAVHSNDVIGLVKCLSMKDSAVVSGLRGDSSSASKDSSGGTGMHSRLVKRTSRDEEVQVSMNREDIYGLLGFLQQDLDKLKTALDQEGIAGEKNDNNVHDLRTCPRQDSAQEVIQLNKELKDLGQQANVLEEKLHESEAIRCDLHRTISIATDMATEERQKCEELTRTKAALEKEMLKLAKENRDLREGLETLSRVRKRRNSRVQHAPRVCSASDDHENDECHVTYLPRAKAHNFSESDISDLETSVTEMKRFPRIN